MANLILIVSMDLLPAYTKLTQKMGAEANEALFAQNLPRARVGEPSALRHPAAPRRKRRTLHLALRAGGSKRRKLGKRERGRQLVTRLWRIAASGIREWGTTVKI